MTARLVARVAIASFLVVPASACDEDAAHGSKPPAPARDRRGEPPHEPRAVTLRVAGPGAFDLVPSGGSAAIAYAPAHAPGTLRIGALRRDGVTSARTVAAGNGEWTIREISAAVAAGRLAIGWVERRGEHRRVRAVLGDGVGRVFGPVRELATFSEARSLAVERGGIDVAATPAGQLWALHRAGLAACPEAEGPCTEVVRRPLRSDPGSRRSPVPLLVPDACDMPVVGQAFVGPRAYFAVCGQRGGEPVTTLYGLQFSPEYAHAEPVLAGCAPMVLGSSERGAVALGVCRQTVQAIELSEAGRELARIGPVRHQARCRAGRPELTLAGAHGKVTRRLVGPTGRLGPWIAARGAPDRGLRAVWTGDRLVAGHSRGNVLSLRRFGCRSDGTWGPAGEAAPSAPR